MPDSIVTALLWFNAIGSGLIAGLFFAFSTFIMTALGRIDARAGIAAMNAINTVILRSLFMPVFMGTTLFAVVLIVLAMLTPAQPGAFEIAAAGVIYVVGMFICTMVFNVPRNNALLAADPANGDGVWTRYLKEWTFWNHVRTIASIVACGLYIAALAAR
jgi:uncharacterized membrane protein